MNPELLQQSGIQRVIAKRGFEPVLTEILKQSTLNKPERLAKRLHENVLRKRSKGKFLKAFLKHKDAKRLIQKPKSKYKPLQYYIKKG